MKIIGLIAMYRDQLRENVLTKHYSLDVDIAHLISYNEELAHKLSNEPAEIFPLVCMSSSYDAFISSQTNMIYHSSKQPSENVHDVHFSQVPTPLNSYPNIKSHYLLQPT